jgi:hypothetical protein
MPAIVQESADSRIWSNGEVTLKFIVTGTTDDQEVRTALLAAAPDGYAGLIPDNDPDIDPGDGVDELTGAACWRCSLRYRQPTRTIFTPSPRNSVRIRFRTTGGTQRIVQSRATRVYGASAPASDGAIGVVRRGANRTIEGVDIPVPNGEWEAVVTFDNDDMPNEGTLSGLTGCSNEHAFTITDTERDRTISFAAWTTIFLGIEYGDPRSDGCTDVTYHFRSEAHQLNQTVAGIAGVDKYGDEYLEVRHEEQPVGTDMVMVPIGVYVHEVVPTIDFQDLGIPQLSN